jgi:hypothetical protein
VIGKKHSDTEVKKDENETRKGRGVGNSLKESFENRTILGRFLSVAGAFFYTIMQYQCWEITID